MLPRMLETVPTITASPMRTTTNRTAPFCRGRVLLPLLVQDNRCVFASDVVVVLIVVVVLVEVFVVVFCWCCCCRACCCCCCCFRWRLAVRVRLPFCFQSSLCVAALYLCWHRCCSSLCSFAVPVGVVYSLLKCRSAILFYNFINAGAVAATAGDCANHRQQQNACDNHSWHGDPVFVSNGQ